MPKTRWTGLRAPTVRHRVRADQPPSGGSCCWRPMSGRSGSPARLEAVEDGGDRPAVGAEVAGRRARPSVIGTDTGAPGAGRGLNGATRVLLIGVLGVVEAGPALALVGAPRPADQVGDGGADGAGQRLDPGAGVLERQARGDGDPDLDAALAGDLGHGPHAEVVERRCGGAGPAATSCFPRGVGAGVEVDQRPGGLLRVVGRRGPGVQLDRAEVGGVGERRPGRSSTE